MGEPCSFSATRAAVARDSLGETMSEPKPPSGEGVAGYNFDYLSAPGVRFAPKDQELILCYLQPKLRGEPLPYCVPINDNDDDVYSQHPKDLVGKLRQSFEGSWYLLSPRDRKYPKGKRPKRGTDDGLGFWKSMVATKDVFGGADGKEMIGHKSGLTYHVFVGEPEDDAKPAAERKRKLEPEPELKPKPKPTEWRMMEFVSINTNKSPDETAANNMLLNDYVLCKITNKKWLDELEDPGLPHGTEVEQGAPTDGSGASQFQLQQSMPSEGPAAGPHGEQQQRFPEAPVRGDTPAAAAALQQTGPGEPGGDVNTIDDDPWADSVALNLMDDYHNNPGTPSPFDFIEIADIAGESQLAEQQQATPETRNEISDIAGESQPSEQQQATPETRNKASGSLLSNSDDPPDIDELYFNFNGYYSDL